MESHIIIVKKHTKNSDLEKYYKEKFNSEFDYLCSIIDTDRFHYARLIEPNELCRYGDILPYEDNYVSIKSGHKFINASWIDIPSTKYFIALLAAICRPFPGSDFQRLMIISMSRLLFNCSSLNMSLK